MTKDEELAMLREVAAMLVEPCERGRYVDHSGDDEEMELWPVKQKVARLVAEWAEKTGRAP